MFKKFIAGTGSKKVFIFFAVFAMTVTVMSGFFSGNRHIDAEVASILEQTGLEVSGLAYRSSNQTIQLRDENGVDIDPIRIPESSEEEPEDPLEGFVYSSEIPLSRELQEYTYKRCKEQNLEYELVLAMMWRESRFQIDAVNINKNGTQDSGIMQINDVNKGWLLKKHGIDDLMDPYQNIDAGTYMLGGLVEKYGEHNALMAYQYGEAGMQAKLKKGETANANVELLYKRRKYYRTLVAA